MRTSLENRRITVRRRPRRSGSSSPSHSCWRAGPQERRPRPRRKRLQAPMSFNDAHFHLTNYIQEGTDIRDFLAIMGDKVGRSTLFGLPLQQMWSYGNTGDFAPWYYLQTDAPLYYYSFIDAMMAMAYRSLPPVAAGAPRPDDHRLQPGGHVRGRPHQAGAAHLPGGVLGDRRVHHPQGVRLVEGRRRGREPHQPGARPYLRLRGRGGAGRDPAQRHQHAVPEAGPGALHRRADARPVPPPP